MEVSDTESHPPPKEEEDEGALYSQKEAEDKEEEDPFPWIMPVRSPAMFLFLACLVVGGGGLIFGYNIGVMSGALGQLEEEFNLTNIESGVVMSILALGSVVGCMFGGRLCDSVLGRWKTIQLQNVVFLFGAVLTAAAPSFAVVIVGRFAIGVASSLSAIADIPYLLEISPLEIQGSISSSYEMLVVLGILISFAINMLFDDVSGGQGWRYMFSLPAPFIAFQILAMFALPESPRYLIDKGRMTSAKNILRQTVSSYYGSFSRKSSNPQSPSSTSVDKLAEDILQLDCSRHSSPQPLSDAVVSSDAIEDSQMHDYQDEGFEIQTVRPKTALKPFKRVPKGNTYSKLVDPPVDTHSNLQHNIFADAAAFKEYALPLKIVIVLMIFQQFTGGVVVRNYAPKIFDAAGFGHRQSLLFNILLGTIKVISTAVAICLIDVFGRKFLLLVGISFTTAGMLTLVISFFVGLAGDVGIFLFAGSLVTAGYAVGFGPVCWVIQSELFPTTIRGRSMAISVFVSNLGQFLMNLIFPVAVESMSSAWVFLFFAAMSVLALVFVCLWLTETKDKSPKDILKDITDNKILCLT